ncbi:MAG: hypothetical protein Q9227_001031 [Pyrenula ochraceoflavens]
MAVPQPPNTPGGLAPPHGGLGPHPAINGLPPGMQNGKAPQAQTINAMNEGVWIQLGNLCELMGDLDGALHGYEQARRHNQWSIPAMTAISSILRTREQFAKAIEYLQNILKVDTNNGDVWGSLGHCHLMMDNLQDAYSSYQQALYYLRDPKEPKLWYGIGILYDRYGSLDHAEEAFTQVMRMDPTFDKANEIYFRLGIIYKQQQKFEQSLECFRWIATNPPRPLNQGDIWFQIGHVYEQQKKYDEANMAYRKVLEQDPKHAKVLQQLGWLHHQQSSDFNSQEQAIEYLEQSVSSDNTDAQSWYLLGRCYMAQQKFPKAYEAYQQAVYRDGRNPTFWCSIGVLYYQINQYRDALDAYSRAIRLNPYISEVWYDLGTLYESCNNQTNDALDAYNRAADLDPGNPHIKTRLNLLRSGQTNAHTQHLVPQDVHPQAYQQGVGVPPGPHWGAPAPQGQPVPVPPGPPGAHRVADWTRGISDMPPQPPPNSYEPRDGMRAPPPARQPSPRPDMRYQDPVRGGPPRKVMSPSPKMNQAVPTAYPGPQSLPQLGQPERSQGTAYGARNQPGANGGQSSAPNGGPPGAPLPPYGRPFSPVTELRPLREERPPSPGSSYPHQQSFHAPPMNSQPNIASGAPPPASAQQAAEAAARERDERPLSAMKRGREWEGDGMPSKKIASDENRARLEDHPAQRPSPPGRMGSPRGHHRRSSSETRREEIRHANENYYPSEAAHRQTTLPSIQNMSSMHSMSEAPRDERKEQIEPAARKMDVDENYDEDGDDERKNPGSAGIRNSPQNGIMNGPSKAEQSA